MNSYKQYVQQQLEKMKTTATQFIASREEQADRRIELEPDTFEKLSELAADRHTSVQNIVHYIVEQHFIHGPGEFLGRISDEHKARNPLLVLDGICRQDHREPPQKAKKEDEAREYFSES